MNINPFTGERIARAPVYSEEYAELEDSDEEKNDPILTEQLLRALQQQHQSNCIQTTNTIASTRTVYSYRLKKHIYATSWNLLELNLKEGQLPPSPIPTPPPSTPDTTDDDDRSTGDSSSDSGSSSDDSAPSDAGSAANSDTATATVLLRKRRKRANKRANRRKRKRRPKEHVQRTDSNVASELSVLTWLKNRRNKELPLLQKELLERQERERNKLKMQRKKYKVLLPEQVRGSTSNILHVIRNAIRSFSNQGMKATRSLYGKHINSPHDLFQAMDRDGDGVLTYDEVRGALHRLGIDMTDLDFLQFIQRVDRDQDGSIDVRELEEAVMHGDSGEGKAKGEGEGEEKGGFLATKRPEKLIWEKVFLFLKQKGVKPTTLFHDIDDDGSGIIGPQELRDGLRKRVGIVLTDEEFQLALHVIDRDGSGEIEYNELSRAIKYGDPARRDNSSMMVDENSANLAAQQMHGRYSLVKQAKTKKNQWDLNFEEIERGVVQVVPRKPTPLFSGRVEQEKSYIGAMNVPRRRQPKPPTKGRGGGSTVDGTKGEQRGRRLVDPRDSSDGGTNSKASCTRPETETTTVPAAAPTIFSPKRPPSSPLLSRHKKNKHTKNRIRLLSKEEEINQQREQWTTTSVLDRGGLTRKQYQFQQRLLKLHPTNTTQFKDKKTKGNFNENGFPVRGDPGGIKHRQQVKKRARDLKIQQEASKKSKGRWGKLKFASKFLMPKRGAGTGGAGSGSGDVVAKKDSRPNVDGVRLDHPTRVAAFVEGQKKAGKSRKDALEALRKLTPHAHATVKATTFFTASDALVARAGTCRLGVNRLAVAAQAVACWVGCPAVVWCRV